LIRSSEPIRFVATAALNTVATYLLYLICLLVMPYWAAYTLSYVAGILISYFLNTIFVFRSPIRWSRLGVYPIVYVSQYLVGLLALRVLIRNLAVSPRIAPLLVVVVTIPITFVLSRTILKQREERPTQAQREGL